MEVHYIMAVRKSQQKCVNKYIDTHYDRINLTVPKGQKEVIQSAAEASGESVNAYIYSAILKRIKQDNEGVNREGDGSDISIPSQKNIL